MAPVASIVISKNGQFLLVFGQENEIRRFPKLERKKLMARKFTEPLLLNPVDFGGLELQRVDFLTAPSSFFVSLSGIQYENQAYVSFCLRRRSDGGHAADLPRGSGRRLTHLFGAGGSVDRNCRRRTVDGASL